RKRAEFHGSCRGNATGRSGLAALTRSRNSLPALKNGTDFSSTGTASPVRGLRPVLASRRLTVNAPNPRSSTRAPRANAAVISSNMVLTMVSTSAPRKCGLSAASPAISSDLVTPGTPVGRQRAPQACDPLMLPERRREVKRNTLGNQGFPQRDDNGRQFARQHAASPIGGRDVLHRQM